MRIREGFLLTLSLSALGTKADAAGEILRIFIQEQSQVLVLRNSDGGKEEIVEYTSKGFGPSLASLPEDYPVSASLVVRLGQTILTVAAYEFRPSLLQLLPDDVKLLLPGADLGETSPTPLVVREFDGAPLVLLEHRGQLTFASLTMSPNLGIKPLDHTPIYFPNGSRPVLASDFYFESPERFTIVGSLDARDGHFPFVYRRREGQNDNPLTIFFGQADLGSNRDLDVTISRDGKLALVRDMHTHVIYAADVEAKVLMRNSLVDTGLKAVAFPLSARQLVAVDGTQMKMNAIQLDDNLKVQSTTAFKSRLCDGI